MESEITTEERDAFRNKEFNGNPVEHIPFNKLLENTDYLLEECDLKCCDKKNPLITKNFTVFGLTLKNLGTNKFYYVNLPLLNVVVFRKINPFLLVKSIVNKKGNTIFFKLRNDSLEVSIFFDIKS